MKMTQEYTQDELLALVREAIAAKGFSVKRAWFEVTADYDYVDRPTGGHSVVCKVEIETKEGGA